MQNKKDSNEKYTVFDFTKDYKLFESLSKSTDDFIFLCDLKKNLFYFPQEMVEEFALPNQILENAAEIWGMKIHENERALFFNSFNEIMLGNTCEHNLEYRVKDKNGQWVWLRCRGHVQQNEDKPANIFAGIITNLGKKSKIDNVSGLLNKIEFDEEMHNILSNVPEQLGLLLLGLDNFKHINNLYGWEFGDKIINKTAQTIQCKLPTGVMFFRLESDIFAIVSQNNVKNELLILYDSISAVFQNQLEHNGHKYYCTISAGYVNIFNEKISLDSFLKRAQHALETAKAYGKNRICAYNALTMQDKDRNIALIELLHESVDSNCENFELYFQPQVNAITRQIESAEALLRWHCNEFSAVGPNEFVPLLEQTGLIHLVGRWVIKNAIATCAKWRKLKPNFVINVNLSYLQLLEEDLTTFLTTTLKENNLPSEALHIELTESCLASGTHTLRDVFSKLRLMGIKIEMDDFGTGYSSLNVLKNEPADVVKIDRAFVKDIMFSEFDSTFIRFVVALCHSVKINVCLEGVETWEEYEIVRTMNLDLIQGFLFGRPQPENEFEKMLNG